jgi:MoaA/NifB/PqqE/SkfB family radical SAM enzyme
MTTDPKIIKIEKKNWYGDYIIQWKPVQMCNYDCSYCDPANHKPIDVDKIPLVDKLISVSEKIKKSIPIDKTVAINITGGEPFLVNDIHLWLESMMDDIFNISIFSNGSMPLKIYKKCLPALKKIRIFLSYHPEFADDDRFVEIATMLKENGGPIGIRGMMVPTFFDKTERVAERLTERGVDFVKIRTYALVDRKTNKINPPGSSSRYLTDHHQHGDINIGYFSKEELKKLKEISDSQIHVDEKEFYSIDCEALKDNYTENIKTSGFALMAGNLNQFKGWKCGLKMKKIVIQPNGITTYGLCRNELPLGNIFRDELLIFGHHFTYFNE